MTHACAVSAFTKRRTLQPSFFAYTEDVDLGWRIWSAGERVLAAIARAPALEMTLMSLVACNSAASTAKETVTITESESR